MRYNRVGACQLLIAVSTTFILVCTTTVYAQDEIDSELRSYIEQGQKINAIKRHRTLHGTDLRTAKTAVDELVERHEQGKPLVLKKNEARNPFVRDGGLANEGPGIAMYQQPEVDVGYLHAIVELLLQGQRDEAIRSYRNSLMMLGKSVSHSEATFMVNEIHKVVTADMGQYQIIEFPGNTMNEVKHTIINDNGLVLMIDVPKPK